MAGEISVKALVQSHMANMYVLAVVDYAVEVLNHAGLPVLEQ